MGYFAKTMKNERKNVMRYLWVIEYQVFWGPVSIVKFSKHAKNLDKLYMRNQKNNQKLTEKASRGIPGNRHAPGLYFTNLIEHDDQLYVLNSSTQSYLELILYNTTPRSNKNSSHLNKTAETKLRKDTKLSPTSWIGKSMQKRLLYRSNKGTMNFDRIPFPARI